MNCLAFPLLEAQNKPPVANNDSYSVNANSTLTVAAPGVLANDTDQNGDPLTAVLVGNVSHGTLQPSANGSFTYSSVVGTGPEGPSVTLNPGLRTWAVCAWIR